MLERPHPRILVVDDEPANVVLLQKLLRRAGYADVDASTDGAAAVGALREHDYDLLLLDLHMPQLDGFGVMAAMKDLVDPSEYLPILVLTADVTRETKTRALSLGARDFVTKPFDHDEVLLRVANLVQTRALHVELRRSNETLAERVRERTRDLEEAQLETMQRLALAAEYRDDDTGEHAVRVGEMAARIARLLGMDEDEVAMLRRAAPLHDVGKIGVSDTILLKPGRLTPEEFAVMKKHAAIGAQILSGSRSACLQMAEVIAYTHHERWDGTGYHGIAGEDIPLPGRIVAVADVFDALTSERPYKRAWPVADALAEIESQAGRQFDPAVVGAFLEVARESIPA
ncbi:MAG TPA: HD domain-containing phosphohydrolase [Actinomycetota bacterium]|nr:HD domain-containing phosphohydrolase [Actinomycetota bacterium]